MKTEQLQIRVSPSQKRAIQQQATRAGMTMSEWVLSRVVPTAAATFQTLVEDLAAAREPSYVFAEILDLLAAMDAEEFELAVSELPEVELDPYWQNYLAATVEHAAGRKGAPAPAWTRDVPPLAQPAFASSLASVRLHLLVASPPAFAARNLFVDATVGDRV